MLSYSTIHIRISKDNQDIGASVDIYWSFNPDMIIDIASGYTKDRLQTIVSSVGKNVIKTVIGKYDVYSLAEKQDVINQLPAGQSQRGYRRHKRNFAMYDPEGKETPLVEALNKTIAAYCEAPL